MKYYGFPWNERETKIPVFHSISKISKPNNNNNNNNKNIKLCCQG